MNNIAKSIKFIGMGQDRTNAKNSATSRSWIAPFRLTSTFTI